MGGRKAAQASRQIAAAAAGIVLVLLGVDWLLAYVGLYGTPTWWETTQAGLDLVLLVGLAGAFAQELSLRPLAGACLLLAGVGVLGDYSLGQGLALTSVMPLVALAGFLVAVCMASGDSRRQMPALAFAILLVVAGWLPRRIATTIDPVLVTSLAGLTGVIASIVGVMAIQRARESSDRSEDPDEEDEDDSDSEDEFETKEVRQPAGAKQDLWEPLDESVIPGSLMFVVSETLANGDAKGGSSVTEKTPNPGNEPRSRPPGDSVVPVGDDHRDLDPTEELVRYFSEPRSATNLAVDEAKQVIGWYCAALSQGSTAKVSTDALIQCAKLLARCKQYRLGLDAYQRVLKRFSADRRGPWLLEAARLASKLGNQEVARKMLDAALQSSTLTQAQRVAATNLRSNLEGIG